MNITQLIVEEVRCFADRQKFEIRPLTFLVGENSTGKTTALACFQVLANYLSSGELDFNLYPHSMGIFKDIVRKSRKSEKTFSLGFGIKTDKENIDCTVKFSEKQGGLEPTVKTVSIRYTDGEIFFKNVSKDERAPKFSVTQANGNQFYVDVPSGRLEIFSPFRLLSGLAGRGYGDQHDEYSGLAAYVEEKYKRSKWILGWTDMDILTAFSTAPVRSRPKRTYDPTREFDDPEGSDVPMRLMRIEATKKSAWESLKEQLIEFGKSSGLFQNIEINNLGRSMGAPFQLRVKVRGPNSNIMDVGYGVSQILPILVQVLDYSTSRRNQYAMPESAFFLLQQPEVHLHPKAQAELSSLLSKLANEGSQSFIVETHSDYMIDRARIEIMKGNISKEDVSLIYLEPKKNVVKVHNISFDNMGNMIGVPPHFRDFFLHESSRLLGFED